MVELEAVAEVAIKHTSISGNNCPENHACRHVTRITSGDVPLRRRNRSLNCDLDSRTVALHSSNAICEVARITQRNLYSRLDFIALVITITAMPLTKGVCSLVQSP